MTVQEIGLLSLIIKTQQCKTSYSDSTTTATPAVKGLQVKLFRNLLAVMVLSLLSLLAALDAGCAVLLKQFRVGLDNTERLVRKFGRGRADSSKGKIQIRVVNSAKFTNKKLPTHENCRTKQ